MSDAMSPFPSSKVAMPDRFDCWCLPNWSDQMLQAALTAQRLQFLLATHWWAVATRTAMAPGVMTLPHRWRWGFDHQLPVPDPLERDAERALFA